MSLRAVDTNETLIVGVIIEVDKNTVLPEKYKGVFKGKTEIERGKYSYWYPVKNTAYSRLVNELNRWYGFKVKYGVMGTMEI